MSDHHSTERRRRNPDAALHTGSGLHPRVYTIMIGLAAWFALAVWSFADKSGVANLLLFVVSGFIAVAVALPLVLASVSRNERLPSGEPTEDAPPSSSLHDWMTRSFRTSSGRVSGRQAMIEALLPIFAAAFGMTLFGIILHVATAGH